MRPLFSFHRQEGLNKPVVTGNSTNLVATIHGQKSLRSNRPESESNPNFANHSGARAPINKQLSVRKRRGSHIALKSPGWANHV